jgi:hypothetical protein
MIQNVKKTDVSLINQDLITSNQAINIVMKEKFIIMLS